MNHNRCWANDNGTTAGRSTATNGCRRPRSPLTRCANWVTVGASNTVRTERSAFSVVSIAAITRIANNESPPRSKNESSTPTRSSPSTSANTPARISSTGLAGAR